MRIGLVIYGSLDSLSGGYLYDRKLVEYLQTQGDTVEVISLPWRGYAAHLADNFRFRLSGSSDSPKLDILIQDELNHPSLILANRGRHPYPVISLVHHLRCSEKRSTWQNAFYRMVERTYLASVDGFIFNSKTTEKVVNDLLVLRKPGHVAYPPTDRFGAPLPEAKIASRAQTHPLRILFLGNVIYRKGLHTLLEAVRQLQSPFRVDVVGGLHAEPAYASRIAEFIKHNDLSSRISLHGPLDREPLVEKLSQAHVLVVPSTYEGFGIVYLEGMCFGLPAIGTTAGAASEVIEDGQTGYLIAPDDSQALGTHLLALAADRNLLMRLSLNARARYLRQPAWEETAGNIRNFLSRTVQQFA
jgi:glycosyltransferase involved in cell wall biosynthesis